jgi:hypothetical protein
MDDLNTCPYCGASPIRIVPAFLFGRPRIDCLTERCPAFSPGWRRELEAEAVQAEATPVTAPDTPSTLGPPPPTFIHWVDGDEPEEEAPPGPIFLWATRHNDFGDV